MATPLLINTTVTWNPDPDKVANALMKAAGQLDNMKAPLRASARVISQDIQSNFDTESAPDGEKWQELSKDWLDYKESIGRDPRILHYKGPLEREAPKFSRFVIEEESGSIFYNATGLPSAGLAHQEGTAPTGLATSIEELAAQADFEDFKTGRGRNLPARPFIGVSLEAEDVIFNVFDLWFSDVVDIKVSSAGVMHESIGGKFGPVIDPRN